MLGVGLGVNKIYGGGAGAGPFDPATLFAAGELGAWYDPSDLSTMSQDSAGTVPAAVGQPVGKMNDKSGRGNHLTMATTAQKPTLRNSGSLYWLEMDGIDDWLDGGTGLGLGMGTLGLFATAAASLSTAANQQILGRTRGAIANGRWALLKEGSATSLLRPMSAETPDKAVAFSATTPKVWTGKYDRAAGTNRLRLNAVTQAPDTAFTAETTDWTSVHRFTIGALRDSADTGNLSGYFMVGNFYGAVIHRSASPSDATISSVETYLGAKAGLTI